jgi:hypothetical protein
MGISIVNFAGGDALLVVVVIVLVVVGEVLVSKTGDDFRALTEEGGVVDFVCGMLIADDKEEELERDGGDSLGVRTSVVELDGMA